MPEQPQVEDISADYRLYFSEPRGYIHLALIVLCAYVIVHLGRLIAHLLPSSRIYLTIIFSYTFLNFNLPMEAGDFADITDAWPVLYEMDIYIYGMESSQELAVNNQDLKTVVSVTTCLLFVQVSSDDPPPRL